MYEVNSVQFIMIVYMNNADLNYNVTVCAYIYDRSFSHLSVVFFNKNYVTSH